MNNNIDIKTLEAFQDGNHKAFETIFITYYNKTKAFIDGYIKSEPDAEELTEDLFVNLWINRHSIDTSKSFNSYLHTIARNAAINFTYDSVVKFSVGKFSVLFISPLRTVGGIPGRRVAVKFFFSQQEAYLWTQVDDEPGTVSFVFSESQMG